MKRTRDEDEVRTERTFSGARIAFLRSEIRDLVALSRHNASDDVVEARVWASAHVTLSRLSVYRAYHARGCEWFSCNTTWQRRITRARYKRARDS